MDNYLWSELKQHHSDSLLLLSASHLQNMNESSVNSHKHTQIAQASDGDNAVEGHS